MDGAAQTGAAVAGSAKRAGETEKKKNAFLSLPGEAGFTGLRLLTTCYRPLLVLPRTPKLASFSAGDPDEVVIG
jgi:hypothetical protein